MHTTAPHHGHQRLDILLLLLIVLLESCSQSAGPRPEADADLHPVLDRGPGADRSITDQALSSDADLGTATDASSDQPAAVDQAAPDSEVDPLAAYYPGHETAQSLGMTLPGWWRPFNDASMWNTPIPPNPAIHPDSAAIAATIAQVAGQTHLGANYAEWSVPVHVVNSANITGEVVYHHSGKPFHGSVDADQNGVSDTPAPILPTMWPDPQGDGHMVIVDPFVNRSWEYIKLYREGGAWKAGVYFEWDLTGSGMVDPFSGKTWWQIGVRGSGVPAIAGLVRPEEIAAGEIRHALALGNKCNLTYLTPGHGKQLLRPAARTDGQYVNKTCPLEGARMQLDPSLDLDALGLGPEAKVVARAFQTYGAYVIDIASKPVVYFQVLEPDSSGTTWKTRYPDLMTDLNKIPLSALRTLAYDQVYSEY